jgi:hypothetical protein
MSRYVAHTEKTENAHKIWLGNSMRKYHLGESGAYWRITRSDLKKLFKKCKVDEGPGLQNDR